MNTALAARIAEEFAATAGAATHGPGLEQRREAIQALAARGLPTARDENWKYSNLRFLEKARFAAAPAGTVTEAELPPPIADFARYTFVDGIFAPSLSQPVGSAGTQVETAHDGPHLGHRTRSGLSADADLNFALLSDAFAGREARIRVDGRSGEMARIEVVFVASTDGSAGASYPRLSVVVEAGSRLGLIERHVSAGSDSSFINSVADIELGRGAAMDHYRIQQTGARALRFDTLTAALAADCAYRLHGVDFGGLASRSTMRIRLAGPGAQTGVFNTAVGRKNQVLDGFALIEHAAPDTRTEQSFRGIAGGRSRIAFNSKIVVQKDARGADSRQSLRGLLAGDAAEIDVRPQLEIYTDEVRCNHGATAGKLDEQMLFYLLSRGLDPQDAQRLLKWAFLEDVVAKIEVPGLRRQIEQSLASQFQDAAALQELL